MLRRELQQVTKTLGGVTQYGFRVTGAKDPLDAEIVWQTTTTPVPTGYEAHTMLVAYTGTRGGVGKGRWAQCTTCKADYPEAEMVSIDGHWYCTANKCNEDFQ